MDTEFDIWSDFEYLEKYTAVYWASGKPVNNNGRIYEPPFPLLFHNIDAEDVDFKILSGI